MFASLVSALGSEFRNSSCSFFTVNLGIFSRFLLLLTCLCPCINGQKKESDKRLIQLIPQNVTPGKIVNFKRQNLGQAWITLGQRWCQPSHSLSRSPNPYQAFSSYISPQACRTCVGSPNPTRENLSTPKAASVCTSPSKSHYNSRPFRA